MSINKNRKELEKEYSIYNWTPVVLDTEKNKDEFDPYKISASQPDHIKEPNIFSKIKQTLVKTKNFIVKLCGMIRLYFINVFELFKFKTKLDPIILDYEDLYKLILESNYRSSRAVEITDEELKQNPNLLHVEQTKKKIEQERKSIKNFVDGMIMPGYEELKQNPKYNKAAIVSTGELLKVSKNEKHFKKFKEDFFVLPEGETYDNFKKMVNELISNDDDKKHKEDKKNN
jgi:hypothetical protein